MGVVIVTLFQRFTYVFSLVLNEENSNHNYLFFITKKKQLQNEILVCGGICIAYYFLHWIFCLGLGSNFILAYFLLPCGGYIVAFTKVLTVYQIYHT
jgi:hypothetical protein